MQVKWVYNYIKLEFYNMMINTKMHDNNLKF